SWFPLPVPRCPPPRRHGPMVGPRPRRAQRTTRPRAHAPRARGATGFMSPTQPLWDPEHPVHAGLPMSRRTSLLAVLALLAAPGVALTQPEDTPDRQGQAVE